MPLEQEVPQISTPHGGTQGLLFCEHTAPQALSGKAPSSLTHFQKCFSLFLMIPKRHLLSTIGKKVTISGGAFEKMRKIIMFSFLVYLESTLPSLKTQQAL
jgi:hypothetical protein